jgi:hypothetical protein
VILCWSYGETMVNAMVILGFDTWVIFGRVCCADAGGG